MKISKVIEKVNKEKQNVIDDDKKIEWLEQLDRKINFEILKPYGKNVELGKYDINTELLVEEPYDVMYSYWLMAMIDFTSQEMNKYANSYRMFNMAYDNFLGFFIRENKTPTIKMKY